MVSGLALCSWVAVKFCSGLPRKKDSASRSTIPWSTTCGQQEVPRGRWRGPLLNPCLRIILLWGQTQNQMVSCDSWRAKTEHVWRIFSYFLVKEVIMCTFCIKLFIYNVHQNSKQCCVNNPHCLLVQSYQHIISIQKHYTVIECFAWTKNLYDNSYFLFFQVTVGWMH